jgi:hypothetical protein
MNVPISARKNAIALKVAWVRSSLSSRYRRDREKSDFQEGSVSSLRFGPAFFQTGTIDSLSWILDVRNVPATALLLQCPANPGEVVVAVSDGMIFEKKLTRQRGIRVEGDWSRPIELLITERSNHRRRDLAIPQKQIDRLILRDRRVLRGMICVHSVDDLRRHALDRLTTGERLGQLDLERVNAGDVMDDHADLTPIPGNGCLPLALRESVRKRRQCASSLFEAIRQGVRPLGGHC